MSKKKREILGVPDYTGAGFEEVTEDLKKQLSWTRDTIQLLLSDRKNVEENLDRISEAKRLLNWLDYWIDLFQDFEREQDRMLNELANGVEQRHVDIIEQIHGRSLCEEEYWSRDFEYNLYSKIDDSFVPLLDRIFAGIKNQLHDYRTLGGLYKRLRTFVGTGKTGPSMLDVRKKVPRKFQIPEGHSWSDLTIRFLDDETISLEIGRKFLGAYEFQVLGFQDERKKVPDKLWQTLRSLAAGKGEIILKELWSEDRQKLKKKISDLRKRLKKMFEIKGNPIYYHHNRASSYKASFNILERIEQEDDSTPRTAATKENELHILQEHRVHRKDVERETAKEVRGISKSKIRSSF